MVEFCDRCRDRRDLGQGFMLFNGQKLCMKCYLKAEKNKEKEEEKPTSLISKLLAFFGFV